MMLVAWFFICALAAGSCCRYPYADDVYVGVHRRRNQMGDAGSNLLSNIELLLPLMVKGHRYKDKTEIHYPNININDFDLELHKYKPYIPHGSGKDQTIFKRNEKINIVERGLKNYIENTAINLQDVKTVKVIPKPMALKLFKLCDRLLKQIGLDRVEIAVHCCVELLNTLFDKDKLAKDDSNKNNNKEKSFDFKTKGRVEKDSNNECNSCSRYLWRNLYDLKHEEYNNLIKKKRSNNLPPVKPLGWFGSYKGRRD